MIDKTIFFSAVAKGQARNGNISAAKFTVTNIRKDKLKDDTYITLVQEMASGGNITGARIAVLDINASGSRIEAYCIIAQAQKRMGKIDEARKTFEQAKIVFEDIKSKFRDQWLFPKNLTKAQRRDLIFSPYDGNFLKTQVMVGDIVGAKQIAESVGSDFVNRAGDNPGGKKKAESIATYLVNKGLAQIVAGQAEIGDFTGAKATAERISDNDNLNKEFAYIAIANKYTDKNGNKNEARAILEKAKVAALNIRRDEAIFCRSVYIDIARAYVRIGDIAKLKEWTEILIDPLILTNLYIGAAEELIEQQNFNKIYNSIPDNETIWVKCANPACKVKYQTGKMGYFEYVEENAQPTSPSVPPLTCEKCGEQSGYRAEKCLNPDCGLVFFRGAVPNDFPDRERNLYATGVLTGSVSWSFVAGDDNNKNGCFDRRK